MAKKRVKKSLESWDQPVALPVLLRTLLLLERRPPSKSTSRRCPPVPPPCGTIWAIVWKEFWLDDTRCWYSRSFSLRASTQQRNLHSIKEINIIKLICSKYNRENRVYYNYSSQSPKFIPLRAFNSSRLQLSKTRPLTLLSINVREYWSACMEK